MWRATWKGLIGHRLRLALTALAITLGVGFVAGSFIFTDSLDRSFSTAFSASTEGFDVQVRPVIDPDLPFAGTGGEPLDHSLVETVRSVEGVAAAEGSVFGFAQLIDEQGEPVSGGAPTLVVSWPSLLPSFSVKNGEQPDADGELALDPATATRIEAEPGDHVQVIGRGFPETFVVTGTASIAELQSFAGVTSIYVPLTTAQRLLELEGKVTTIEVSAAAGTKPEVLIERITPLLPERIEAVSAQAVAEQQAESIRTALGFLNTFLLVFAGIALFVGAFLIQNTFRIVVAQRVRELALLRVVGATAGQVTRMVLLEAVLVALAASIVGVGVGVGLALLIRFAFETTGGSLGDAALVIEPRTFVIAVLVGLVVTTVSALLPALQASRIPPVAALRGTEAPPRRRSLRRRAMIGAVIALVGLGLLGLGLFAQIESERVSEIQLVGAGAAILFVGVAVLAPLFARPVAAALGWPLLKVAKVPGNLARGNAMRSPARTAATASALMIGLALVGMTVVLADSIKTTTRRLLDEQFRADLVVSPAGFGGGTAGFSPEVAKLVAALPEVVESTPVRFGPVRVADDTRFLSGSEVETLAGLVDFVVVEGSTEALGDGSVAVLQDTAIDLDLELGDTVEMTLARTGIQTFTVELIFESNAYGNDFLLDLPVYETHMLDRLDNQVLIKLADGVGAEGGATAVEQALEAFPGIQVQDQSEFRDQIASQVNVLLAFVVAMLALAIVIAFFGITNTLSLSIIERTREIGLLRAVGMSRRQLWAMVTGEAVVVAAFGALLGALMGIGFGWAVVEAFTEGDLYLSIPWWQLGLGVVVASAAGVVAALFPAWRASRLDVLQAIAYE